jgi:hypothetical protein
MREREHERIIKDKREYERTREDMRGHGMREAHLVVHASSSNT